MLSLFAFIGITSLLLLEGWYVLGFLGLDKGSSRIMLSLPIATFSSTLLILLLTILGIALTPLSILCGHFVIILLARHIKSKSAFTLPNPPDTAMPKAILIACSLLLLITGVYSATHALLLPTFHYDSATNWNMRSKVSFTEQQLVLTDRHDLIVKPHYPFLYHALQITTQQGQPTWNDRMANAIHFLLSLSALAALFLLIRALKGSTASLLALTAIATTPLFAMHLGGGYADIPLTLFALLSLATFFLYDKTSERRLLFLSAIFVGACVWTKSEGLPFALIPWLLMVVLHSWKHSSLRSINIKGALLALCISLAWPLFAQLKGLPLSPHGSYDLSIALQEGAIGAAASVLFTGGSFGPVLPLALFCAVLAVHLPNLHKQYRWGLVWGLAALLITLFVYLFTNNAVFLLNGQSFDRQLLLPVSLLVLTLVLCLFPSAVSQDN
jgi:hypothetical protein